MKKLDLILKFIQEKMEEKGITNYRLSKLTGISQQMLARYFSKESDMSLTNFLKICNALEFELVLNSKKKIKNNL